MRIATAFVIAPLVPSLLVLPIAALFPGYPAPGSLLGLVVFLALFSPLFAVPAAWVLGVPLFLYFRKRGWLGLFHTLAAGGVVAAVATFLFALLALLTTPNYYAVGENGRLYLHWTAFTEGLSYALMFVPFGIIIAAIFWLIGLRHANRRLSNA